VITACTGHVTTAGAALLVWYTHAVEYSDGELATDALTDADRVTLPVRDGMKPPVLDADADRETEALRVALTGDADPLRDADPETDAVTLKPRDCDRDGVGVGDTSVHCTYSRKLVWNPHPPPPDVVSVLGTMEHEFWPRHDAFTDAPLAAAPAHVPSANGPDGHAPVGLP